MDCIKALGQLLALGSVDDAIRHFDLVGHTPIMAGGKPVPRPTCIARAGSVPLVRVQLVDPAAYTPPYDHALAEALAAEGAVVELATAPFPYGDVPDPVGYTRVNRFYKGLPGRAGSPLLRAGRAIRHVPDMLAWRKSAEAFDIVHAQWLAVQGVDIKLLPAGQPLVMTAHDVLPREPRPGQVEAQAKLYSHADAVVVHTEHGKGRLINEVGLPESKIEVIPHGPFTHISEIEDRLPLPHELEGPGAHGEKPVVLFFGLLRPYKGLDVLLDAWDGVEDAELWIVGRPRMDTERLRNHAAELEGVKFLTRWVEEREIPSIFNAATACVLPYREIDQSGVLATALAFETPLVTSQAGGLSEAADRGAAISVPVGDVESLHDALVMVMGDTERQQRLSAAAHELAHGEWSWQGVARKHMALYERLIDEA